MYYSSGVDGGLIILVIILWLLVCVGGLVAQIFYLLTLQNTLNAVSPENQRMPGGQVWMMFIPLFNLGWQFVIVNRIADSLEAEFAKRNIACNELRPGYSVGIAMCVLVCCCIIPFVNILASIAAVICWIIYWVKINRYKKMVQESNANPMATTSTRF